jgi:hypothetical protein
MRVKRRRHLAENDRKKDLTQRTQRKSAEVTEEEFGEEMISNSMGSATTGREPGMTQDTQIRLRYLKAYPDFTDATSPVLIRNAQEALAYGTAAGAAWARGSPLAEKWDDAASDAIEDLVVAAVRREQQSGRRRRPYSARSGYTPF